LMELYAGIGNYADEFIKLPQLFGPRPTQTSIILCYVIYIQSNAIIRSLPEPTISATIRSHLFLAIQEILD